MRILLWERGENEILPSWRQQDFKVCREFKISSLTARCLNFIQKSWSSWRKKREPAVTQHTRRAADRRLGLRYVTRGLQAGRQVSYSRIDSRRMIHATHSPTVAPPPPPTAPPPSSYDTALIISSAYALALLQESFAKYFRGERSAASSPRNSLGNPELHVHYSSSDRL